MNEKIKYTENITNINAARVGMFYEYTIVESICKKHFKDLMNISRFYNNETKTGYIEKHNTERFLSIVINANKANSNTAKASHKKAIEKKAVERAMTIYDFCEDYFDMDYSLMNTAERTKAWAAYKNN